MIQIRAAFGGIFSALRDSRPLHETIGGCRIRLPMGSRSPEYKRRFKLYDRALGVIAGIVHGKYPDLRAIDIGANVGDTAALIRGGASIPVLCIEGDRALLPILRENAAGLGPGVEVEPGFIGPDGLSVDVSLIDDPGRNASIRNAIATAPGDCSSRLRSLKRILEDHPAFCAAKLLKTDTEGCDFNILRQSADYLATARPVIFFEYDPHLTPDEPGAGLATIEFLAGNGYSDFLYFDNFGNYLLHASPATPGVFADLDHYLASNRRHGVAVYYFDICAFHSDDRDLIAPLKAALGRDAQRCASLS